MTHDTDTGRADPTRRSILRTLGAAGLGAAGSGQVSGLVSTDEHDGPEYPSPEWFARDLRNYARTQEANEEHVRDSAFLTRLAEQNLINRYESERRSQREPGWDTQGNICSERYYGPCAGDPFLYPEPDIDPEAFDEAEIDLESLAGLLAEYDEELLESFPEDGTHHDAGEVEFSDDATPEALLERLQAEIASVDRVPTWRGHPFYEEDGGREQIAFYDSGLKMDDGGARLNGHVWVPKHSEPGDDLPGIVVANGGAATEAMYWWAAIALVRQGYVVMTYDPRGAGKSDNDTPEGRSGDSTDIRFRDLVDAIDLFTATPSDPYPHNTEEVARDDDEAAGVVDYNPFWDRLDRDRIGACGHSRGAASTVNAQSQDPWPGAGDENPIRVGVAWDSLWTWDTMAGREIEPRVPMLGMGGDYYYSGNHVPVPKQEPPDAERKADGYYGWREAGVPVFDFNIRGAGHFEYSLGAGLPTTSWDHWGNPLAEHYTVAWFDYWLKERGESGYDTAEDRLLETEPWHDRMSFYYVSAYAFPPHHGRNAWPANGSTSDWHVCEDVRDGC